jgi:vancomycin permeability regulator SanA
MQEYAIAHGVPPNAILTDVRGQSTFLTLLNCKDGFGLDRIALVSHSYHLPRALYIARKLGITAYGRVVQTEDESPAPLREWGGRVKDFFLVRVFRYFHDR